MDLSHVLAAAVHLAAPDATHQARRAPERRSSDAPTYADSSTTAKFAFGTPTVDGDLLLEKCLHVLKIEPSQRSHSHVEDLMRLLDLGGWLGASGGRTNLRQMARELVLREAARGDVLFHPGDPARARGRRRRRGGGHRQVRPSFAPYRTLRGSRARAAHATWKRPAVR